MLNVFNNLPGIYVYKDDGNLRVLDTIPGEVTVVLGTSPDGPTGLYSVQDTGSAEALFDPSLSKDGTLLRGMYEALEAGSQYVALYRIGSSPVAVDFINGYTIVTNDANASAGSKYKLYYTNDHLSSGIEVIRVYDSATGTIVYDSYAGIDTGLVTVYGTQYVAPATESITIGNDVATWSTSPTFAALKDFTQSDYSVGPQLVIDAMISTKTFNTLSSAFKAGQLVQISGALEAGDNGYYTVSFVTTDDNTTYKVTLDKEVTYSAGTVTESVFPGFAASESSIACNIKAKFIESKDGLSMTLNEKFAAYAKAYWNLEAAQVDMVIPTNVYFNENNVVDNEGKFKQDELGYAAPSAGDFLGKVSELEHNGQLFFAFKNSFANDSDVTADELPTPYELGIDGYAAKAWLEGTHAFDTAIVNTSDAEIASAADDISYSECNFGHQLASYLHSLSTNDNEASGVIAMKSPSNFGKAAISQWLGKAPVKNATGNITISGRGLLGYKYMAGSINVAEGLFATSNGYVDASPILDRNNMAVDIGRYVDVISTSVILKSAYDGSSSGYKSPGAGVYGGLVMGTAPNVAVTNAKLNSKVSLPFVLAKTYLDELVGTKYVAFGTTPSGLVKVVDAPTAALSTSDWNRRVTNRIAGYILDRVRSLVDPFIGKITTQQMALSLEEQVNSLLNNLQNTQNQFIKGGIASIKQTKAMAIKGEAALQLTLITASELRRVVVYLSLSK